MSPLFKKLNLGAGKTIHVLNAPASFEHELDALHGVKIMRSVNEPVTFGMAFVITQRELNDASLKLTGACAGDAILWMIYPKGTSKKYSCEFTRDSGWSALGAAGFEPVRMVAVDLDWSALRFRRANFIKTMTRNPGIAISSAGQKKAARGDA